MFWFLVGYHPKDQQGSVFCNCSPWTVWAAEAAFVSWMSGVLFINNIRNLWAWHQDYTRGSSYEKHDKNVARYS